MTFNTRRTLLAAALGLAAAVGTVTVLAGPGWPHGDRAACAEERLARIAERYDLSPEQQAQVKTILEEQRAAAQKLQLETRQRIEGVLTEVQRTALEARVARRLDRQVDRLARRLDLKPEQATQVRAILADRKADPSLDRAEIDKRIGAVLTPEQRARFEAMSARGDRQPKCGGRGGRPMGPPPGAPMGAPMGGPMGPPMGGPMSAPPMDGPMAGPPADAMDEDADLDPGEEAAPEPR